MAITYQHSTPEFKYYDENGTYWNCYVTNISAYDTESADPSVPTITTSAAEGFYTNGHYSNGIASNTYTDQPVNVLDASQLYVFPTDANGGPAVPQAFNGSDGLYAYGYISNGQYVKPGEPMYETVYAWESPTVWAQFEFEKRYHPHDVISVIQSYYGDPTQPHTMSHYFNQSLSSSQIEQVFSPIRATGYYYDFALSGGNVLQQVTTTLPISAKNAFSNAPYRVYTNGAGVGTGSFIFRTPGTLPAGAVTAGPGLYIEGSKAAITSAPLSTTPFPTYGANNVWWTVKPSATLINIPNAAAKSGAYSVGIIVNGSKVSQTATIPAKALDNGLYYTYNTGVPNAYTGNTTIGRINSGNLQPSSLTIGLATDIKTGAATSYYNYTTTPPTLANGMYAGSVTFNGLGFYVKGAKQTTMLTPLTSLVNSSKHYFVSGGNPVMAGSGSVKLDTNAGSYVGDSAALSAAQVLANSLSASGNIQFFTNGIYSGGNRVVLPPGLTITSYASLTSVVCTYTTNKVTVSTPKTVPVNASLVVAPSSTAFAAVLDGSSIKLKSGPVVIYQNASKIGIPVQI